MCVDAEEETLALLSLYRFASKWDLFMLFIGCIFTFIKACNYPFLIVIYGEFIAEQLLKAEQLQRLSYLNGLAVEKTNASREENMAEIKNDASAYLAISLLESAIQLFAGAICVDCFNRTAISQVTRMRVKYFTSLMRQDMGWYDVEKSKSNYTVRLAEDIEKIKTGIAEQVSHFLNTVLASIIGIVLSFIYGWKLTLIVLSYVPIVCLMNFFIAKFQVVLSTSELNVNSKAANIAEEVLSGIRTVFAFGGEKLEVERYKKHLQPAQKVDEKKGLIAAIAHEKIEIKMTPFLPYYVCKFTSNITLEFNVTH